MVSVAEQRVYLIDRMRLQASYMVSTSKYGTGTRHGSQRTPTGAHYVACKIGEDAPLLTVFVGRRATRGKAVVDPPEAIGGRDVISSRILWLAGLEYGRNAGWQCDSMQRHIYIHGTDDEKRVGRPSSHGCIRMKNNDVCELFDVLHEGSLVYILANGRTSA